MEHWIDTKPSPTQPNTRTSVPAVRENRRRLQALQTAAAFALLALVNLPEIVYLAIRTQAWQFWIISGHGLALLVIFGLTFREIRRSQEQRGASYLLYALLTLPILPAALLEGTGLILGVASACVYLLIAPLFLTFRQTNLAAALGAATSFLAGALDLIHPSIQLAIPSYPLFLGIASLLVLFIPLVDVFLHFSDQNLGTRLRAVFLAIALLPFLLLASLNARAASASALPPFDSQLRANLTLAIAVLDLILLASAFAVRLITRPIGNLTEAARKVARGDFEAMAWVGTDDEIGALAIAFNAMTVELRHLIKNLENRVEARTRAIRTGAEISRNISTILERNRLLEAVVEQLKDSFGYSHVEIYLFDDNRTMLIPHRSPGLKPGNPGPNPTRPRPGQGVVGKVALSNKSRIVAGLAELSEEDRPWVLPDTRCLMAVPIASGTTVRGVIDLQQDVEDGFSQLDATLVEGVANQLAIALENAHMYARERSRAEEITALSETVRKIDIFVLKLLETPDQAIETLYTLTLKAHEEPSQARMLANLPNVLANMGEDSMAGLAQGFNYLYAAQNLPEVLPAGIRALVDQLEAPSLQSWQHADHTLQIFRLCNEMLEINTISKITQFAPKLKLISTDRENGFLTGLAGFFPKAHQVAEALYAYERVDNARDKLSYLASTLERLRHIEHRARIELNQTDRLIVEHLSQHWFAIVTVAMTELQTRAHVYCELLTRNVLRNTTIPLTILLRNDGPGVAINVEIRLTLDDQNELDESSRLVILEQAEPIDRLAPGVERELSFLIRPPYRGETDYFRVRISVLYTDPRGPEQVENYADVVQLINEELVFQFIPSPYVVGTPLGPNSPLFFGREEVFKFIQTNLEASHRNNLVLIGQRRTGKTSLLRQLPARLESDFLSVYIDGQTLGLDPGLPAFFYSLATDIAFALEDNGYHFPQPRPEDFRETPAIVFERSFLVEVRKTIGERHLLILLDEFEELEAAVRRANLDPSIFGFLRHLIQHTEHLSVIFSGTNRLEELATDYWNILFNISLYKHIAYLDKEQALMLVQEPVGGYGMRYDALALEKIWRVTAGHPYFLQLLCHSLVNLHNRVERNYITVADVNTALEEILTTGEAHFLYLWTGASPVERLAMIALSRMIPLSGQATPIQVVDYLEERGITIDRQSISQALHHLELREVLSSEAGRDLSSRESYRWRLGLLGLWAEKYKSLSRVVDDLNTSKTQPS